VLKFENDNAGYNVLNEVIVLREITVLIDAGGSAV